MVLHALHLCSGYGGFELALRLAGVPARTVAHVERDAYAAATLVARMDEAHLDQAPIWSDLNTFDPGPWAGRVDIITAGFPCQPFSSAGQQRGTDDERWLWPAIGRLIGDVGPRFVFLENVPGLIRAGLPHVLSDLAQLGFDAEWGLFSAAEVGAPHQRERFWLLAHAPGDGSVHARQAGPGDRSNGTGHWCGFGSGGADVVDPDGDGLQGIGQRAEGDRGGLVGNADRPSGAPVAEPQGSRLQGRGVRRPGPAQRSDRSWPPGRDDHTGWSDWIAAGGPEPALRRSTHGRPAELADALHLGGNGLVPAVAAAALVELARRLDVTHELFNGRND